MSITSLCTLKMVNLVIFRCLNLYMLILCQNIKQKCWNERHCVTPLHLKHTCRGWPQFHGSPLPLHCYIGQALRGCLVIHGIIGKIFSRSSRIDFKTFLKTELKISLVVFKHFLQFTKVLKGDPKEQLLWVEEFQRGLKSSQYNVSSGF